MPKQPKAIPFDENPGGARVCEQHKRLECTKNRTKGRGPCHQAAVRGTDRCFIHAGMRRETFKAQGEARITAWNPMGKQAKIDPGMAVMGVLQMSWLRLAWVSDQLRKQIFASPETAGNPVNEDVPEASGLIGFRYGAAGKDGVIYVQSEEIRGLVALEAQERDRVVRFAKTAHDMGISKRLTDLAERWGDLVASRIATMLEELDLTPEQAVKVPSLLHKHLGSVDVDSGMGDPATGKDAVIDGEAVAQLERA